MSEKLMFAPFSNQSYLSQGIWNEIPFYVLSPAFVKSCSVAVLSPFSSDILEMSSVGLYWKSYSFLYYLQTKYLCASAQEYQTYSYEHLHFFY